MNVSEAIKTTTTDMMKINNLFIILLLQAVTILRKVSFSKFLILHLTQRSKLSLLPLSGRGPMFSMHPENV
jgi:hypothetical protein